LRGEKTYAYYKFLWVDELVVEDGIEYGATELAGCAGES
jgi:hypothetical protein